MFVCVCIFQKYQIYTDPTRKPDYGLIVACLKCIYIIFISACEAKFVSCFRR